MTLKPRTGQILVKPDPTPTQTDSGFYIPDAYGELPPMSGIVVAVGPPDPASQPAIVRARAQAIRQCLAVVEEMAQTVRPSAEHQLLCDRLGRLLTETPEPEDRVQVGQRVVFPNGTARSFPLAGFEVVLGEDTQDSLLVLREQDILAIYEAEGVAA